MAETLKEPQEIRFAADRMLGRLAKMLRLLGYDTLYSAQFTAEKLREIARQADRFILTRGAVTKRFPVLANVYRVESEYPVEQLREVVTEFSLDTKSGLWTRCTLCNGPILLVDRQEAEESVKPKVFELYDEFFRCSGCGHFYWRGSHTKRVLEHLDAILG